MPVRVAQPQLAVFALQVAYTKNVACGFLHALDSLDGDSTSPPLDDELASALAQAEAAAADLATAGEVIASILQAGQPV